MFSNKMTTQKIFNILFLVSVLTNTSAFAAEGKQQGFRSFESGFVQFNNEKFSSMREFVGSQSFRDSGRRCGFERAATQQSRFVQSRELQQPKSPADCTNVITKIKAEYQPTLLMEIPVWFHVISRTDGTGNISDQRINAQIKVLNEDFLALSGTQGAQGINTKIQFVLKGITRTVNNAWYTDSNADEVAYKTALNVNPSKFLNIYTNDAAGFLGYAYFPTTASGQYYDGVVLLDQSVGGRNNGFGQYDQGRTAVHEIGHYLGLYHTFQGGSACSNSLSSGDYIADTNAEATPFYGGVGCPSRSTCGTPDPVDNYMDYNVDSCMNKFTSQQVNRMICSAVNYRPDLLSVVTVEDGKTIITPIYNLLLD